MNTNPRGTFAARSNGVGGLVPAVLLLAALLGGNAAEAAVFPRGVVAADHALASEAGAEMLRKGGNAVDAAVATSFALSVVRPYSCGIGGGGFMVICFREDPKHGNKRVALNYREVAPAAVGKDYYEKLPEGASVRGGKAAGVPGTVAGLLHALERYGTLPRQDVLAPAIRLAEAGFVADRHYVESVKEVVEWTERDPSRREKYRFVWERFLKGGKIAAGDRVVMREQADALRLIAEKGVAGFYEGEVAAAVVAALSRDGGEMTREDLGKYRVSEVEPLTFNAFGRTFVTMPPPSSGGVAMAEIVGVLEALGVGKRAGAGLEEAAELHLLVEAMKHAFADRARWMGDPAFVKVPVKQLTSPDYWRQLAAKVKPAATLPAAAYGTTTLGAEDGGTSHFGVVDARGNAVACTETINLIFGSLVAVEKYGFVLNDEMDDFTTKAGAANAFGLTQSEKNAPAPGKRPLSSMTPTIVLDHEGNVEVTAGASGGPRIITGTVQVILNVLLRDDDAETAVARPRLHHQWMPEVLGVEEKLPSGVRAGLERRGHKVEQRDAVGNVQVIRRAETGQGWDAASDPRKGGAPAGE